MQGQTPLAARQSGATTQAYNCNLEKVGQFEGEGASWQLTWFEDLLGMMEVSYAPYP